MKLFQKTQQKQSFYDLPKKTAGAFIEGGEKANKQQKRLENRYLKLRAQAK